MARPQNTYRSTKGANKKRARLMSVSNAPVSPGLKRYLANRGTPRGTYEITRWTSTNIPIIAAGFNVNGTVEQSFSCVFTPQSVIFYNAAGTTTTFVVAIPNAAELAALFDDVKLDKVEIYLSGGVNPSVNTTNAQVPQVFMCSDRNDRASSIDAIRQESDCTVWDLNQPGGSRKKFTVKPYFQQVVQYGVAGTTSATQAQRGYVKSDIDIEHLAFKIALEDSTNGSASDPLGRINLAFKYYFKFKQLR